MARAAYMISLHPERVEGVGIERGVVQPGTAVTYAPPAGASGPPPVDGLLEGFFERAHWEPRPAVIVLNTEDVRIRKIEFPFSNPKKIRQTLQFELEHLLLEPVENLVYDFRILPRPDGSAETLVYLVPRDDVERILAVCGQHNIDAGRITFSAHALSQDLGEHPEDGFLLYAGNDEIFIADIVHHDLHAVKSIAQELPDVARRDAVVAPPDAASAADPVGGSPAPAAAAGNGAPTLDVVAHLGRANEEINRFIRTHGLGRSQTNVIVKGCLAPYFQWQAESGYMALQTPANGYVPPDGTGLSGVLRELQANPRILFASRGINFSLRRGAWLAQLRELQGVLIVLGVLLILVLGMAGFNLTVSIRRDLEYAARLREQATAIVKQFAPRATTPEQGLRELQGRLRQLQQNRALAAEFTSYHYDMLNLLKVLSDVYKEFPRLTVDSFSFAPERITLAGTTDTYQGAESLKNRLGEMPRFKGKTINVSNQRNAQTITYRITIE